MHSNLFVCDLFKSGDMRDCYEAVSFSFRRYFFADVKFLASGWQKLNKIGQPSVTRAFQVFDDRQN